MSEEQEPTGFDYREYYNFTDPEEFDKQQLAERMSKIKENFGHLFRGGVELVQEFSILYSGWECDDKAWLIKDSGDNYFCFGTNHGSLCQLDKKELMEKIEEYEKVLRDTRHVWRMLL